MICYRDMTFCKDTDKCVTPDSECHRIFTDDDYERVMQMEIPVAWASFKETCGKFKDKKK